MATDLSERGFIRYVKEWIRWDLDIVHHSQWVRKLEADARVGLTLDHFETIKEFLS